MKVILKTVLVAGLTMLLGAGVCGCGKKDAEKTDQSKSTLDQSTPETVAKTWWQAVVDEDFKTVETVSTPALAKELTDDIKAKMKKAFAQYKGKEIAADPAKIKESDGKKFATVQVILAPNEQKLKNSQRVRLIFQDGKWMAASPEDLPKDLR